MIQITEQINTPILLTLLNPSGNPGEPVPSDVTFVKDGTVMASPFVDFHDVGVRGLYNFGFMLAETGTYVMYAYGAIQAQIEVVTKSIYTYLQNLEDESLGSWQWDKVAGTLTMLRQDGTNLASFSVIDNLTEASRERTT